MSYLLDANVLIALGWPAHEHHKTTLRWFTQNASAGWSTTPFTQAAFVRIISQPAFSGRAIGIDEIADVLLRNVSHAAHRFLAMDFGIEQVLGCCTGGVVGPRQVADAYLLTCAIRNRAQLVTYDAGIPWLLATAEERARHIVLIGGSAATQA